MGKMTFCSDAAEFLCISFMLYFLDDQFLCFFEHVARDGFLTDVPPGAVSIFFWASKAVGNVLEFSHGAGQ